MQQLRSLQLQQRPTGHQRLALALPCQRQHTRASKWASRLVLS
jgi:hypothetical protein